MKVCISQFSLQMFFKVISKVKPCDSGQKRKDKQQRGTDSVTETWINKCGLEDTGCQEVKTESEMVSST